jgi:hypothetical protein
VRLRFIVVRLELQIEQLEEKKILLMLGDEW